MPLFRIQSPFLPYQHCHWTLKTHCCTKASSHVTGACCVPCTAARCCARAFAPGFAICQGLGPGRFCSASSTARESMSGSDSMLGAVSGEEQIETVQRLLYIWHRRRIFYSTALRVQQITRQHPLLAGREQRSRAKYPPASPRLIQRVRHSRRLRFSRPSLGGFYAAQSAGGEGWGQWAAPRGG